MTSITSTNTSLTDYVLHLADNALILGHRNSEWCGHGPILEQDIAITNISLDLIGQARNLYQYAAVLLGNESTEDSLAYLRNPEDFKNCLLVEQPNGDWAATILRQFFFSTYQYLLYENLVTSQDPQLAAIAAKSLKEVTYHLRWSSEWVIRLGDGTDESHQRITSALQQQWPLTDELTRPAPYEARILDPSTLKTNWLHKIQTVFDEAGLQINPDYTQDPAYGTPGKSGIHSLHLKEILDEMQVLPRTYPGTTW